MNDDSTTETARRAAQVPDHARVLRSAGAMDKWTSFDAGPILALRAHPQGGP